MKTRGSFRRATLQGDSVVSSHWSHCPDARAVHRGWLLKHRADGSGCRKLPAWYPLERTRESTNLAEENHSIIMSNWTPTSWQTKPATQQVQYRDPHKLDIVLKQLAKLPPLVTSWEVETLKSELAAAARGERFLLQGGDCSESFDDCCSTSIASKLKILLKMSIVMVHGGHRQVIRVGRFAGQYAKPRSSDRETRDGVTLPSFRGHLINRLEFTPEAREPNPDLLLRAYERSALTINFVRGLVDGGFADLHHPELWDLDFLHHSPLQKEYRRIVDLIADAVGFLEVVTGRSLDELQRIDFFASHEGLPLPYEQAQTRRVPRRTGWYNLSTHFPWIGDRTRSIGGAHVEYFRGIANPIGMKVGPTMTPDQLIDLIDVLNPQNEPGRLTSIHRFGTEQIATCLPPLIEAVVARDKTVVWCCDPMHGNTTIANCGLKTRRFDDVLGELNQAMDIHAASGSILGGVHFELTGENVTECIGGARGLTEDDLEKRYLTDVDPRLSYEQALEMALLIARRMRKSRPS